MTGPVPTNQDEPLDPAAFHHQLLLLKSAHCCRPVVYRGLNKFINGLTLHQDGGQVAMTVYLAGSAEPIDSAQVEIKSASGKDSAIHDGPAQGIAA
jgi:hypothetical protein